MPRITWAGVVQDTAKYQAGFLPEGAKKLDLPVTMGEMLRKALPFALLPIVVIVFSMFLKTWFAGQPVVTPFSVAAGFLLGFFVGIPLHELLHAAAYPKEATVSLGVLPKQFAAVALVSYPLCRGRFILMSLLPALLGLIPLLLFLLSPAASRTLNGVAFGLMLMGLTSPYPDYYQVYQVLKQTKKGCLLQFEKDALYEIPASESL